MKEREGGRERLIGEQCIQCRRQYSRCSMKLLTANPMMHPITVWVVDTGMPMYVAIIIMKLADTRLVNIPNMTTSGISS